MIAEAGKKEKGEKKKKKKACDNSKNVIEVSLRLYLMWMKSLFFPFNTQWKNRAGGN